MKTFILISLIFCSATFYANKPKTAPLKISQYDYFDFMDEFALDDTSVVIIDLFLRKRNEQGVGEMSFLPVTSSVTLIVPPIGLALSAIASPFAIHGGYLYLKYSKKRLAKTLKKYNEGRGLSKHLTKKIIKHYRLMKHENTSQY